MRAMTTESDRPEGQPPPDSEAARHPEGDAWIRGRHGSFPVSLVEAITGGRCLLFAGSGSSAASLTKARKPLPGWQDLLVGLLAWPAVQEKLDTICLKELIELTVAGKLEIVAQEVIDQVGADAVGEYLETTFDPSGIVPSRRHLLMAALPFRGIVTTNYDNLIERAYAEERSILTSVLLGRDVRSVAALERPRHWVLKLHGDISQPESVILGYSDFVAMQNSPGYQRVLDHLAKSYRWLMIGYSLRDREVIAALERAALRPNGPEHMMLVRKDSLTGVETRHLRAHLNLRVFEYEDHFGQHEVVEMFLESLHELLSRDVELPSVRGPVASRITTHWTPRRQADGEFVQSFLFREGAVVWALDQTSTRQLDALRRDRDTELRYVDHVVLLLDKGPVPSPYSGLVAKALACALRTGVQVLILAIGTHTRPSFAAKHAPAAPIFYLEEGFSERDLAPIRDYLIQAGPSAGRRRTSPLQACRGWQPRSRETGQDEGA